MSVLLSYSVVKEPTSSKGPTSCQTPPSVSSGKVSLAVLLANRFRLMRTRGLTLVVGIGKIELPRTAGSKESKFVPPHCQPSRREPSQLRDLTLYFQLPTFFAVVKEPCHVYPPITRQASPDIPGRILHNSLCSQALLSISKTDFAASGPSRTTLPASLFHDLHPAQVSVQTGVVISVSKNEEGCRDRCQRSSLRTNSSRADAERHQRRQARGRKND